jgi:hypothetical protein
VSLCVCVFVCVFVCVLSVCDSTRCFRVLRWSYGYYLLLIVPTLPFISCGVLTALAWIWSKKVKLRELKGFHQPWMCTSNEQVLQYFRSLLKKSIPFLGVVYNNTCLQSFQAFSCVTLRDGSSVVSAAPGIVCYTDEHNTLVGVAVLALIVYVIGLPAVTLGTTMYARYMDKLRDPVWLDTIGLFYREYGTLPVSQCLLQLCWVVVTCARAPGQPTKQSGNEPACCRVSGGTVGVCPAVPLYTKPSQTDCNSCLLWSSTVLLN